MSRVTAEGIVGTYKGIKVYRTTLPEYVNGRLYKDEDNMFLINGELIYKNEIFAKYDGNYVTEYDPHERATYYTIPDNFKRAISNYNADNDRDTVNKEKNETENLFSTGNFEFKTVDEILAGSLGSEATNYFSSMTDIDAFLK